MDPLFEKVKTEYLLTHSVNAVSKKCSISRVKVRKILITLGLYESELSKDISNLLSNNYGKKEICDYLKISISTLNEHTPYEKGMYQGETRSKQAIRSERFRIKELRNIQMINNLKNERVNK